MSRRQDPALDSKRRLYALIFALAWALYAVLATGCAGVNLRHLTVKIDGERVVIPDGLATQYFRLRMRPLVPSFAVDSYHVFPRGQYIPYYGRHPCAMLTGRFIRWCWDNGYPDAYAPIYRRDGQTQTHTQAVVNIDGRAVHFDLTDGSIKGHGPEGWEHHRVAFKYEILNVKEWQ